jgi:hypothetical protein
LKTLRYEPQTGARAGELLLEHGFFRRPKFRLGADAGHKEWLHFCVHSPEVDLLANFSLVDDVRPGARAGSEFARVVCLARESGWLGDLDEYTHDEVSVAPGRLALEFGANRAVLRDGGFDLKVRMRRLELELDLRLEPVTLPTLANNIFVDDCPPIHWIVLPRLEATGTVTIGGRLHRLQRATAYHDHNWGSFRWGKNFAWEWGYAAPDVSHNPWTLVFVRLCDRPHLSDLMRIMVLWRGREQLRLFHSDEVTVWHEGLLRAQKVFKLPRVMGLVSPGDATDVPKRFIARARRGSDHLDLEFVANDLAQVIIPNDDDLGVTIINEVSGHVSVNGKVGGERVEIDGTSIFEFLGE